MVWISVFSALSLAVVGPASAALELVAHADFDADTPGASPDASLPGGPAGDSFYPAASGGVGTYTVEAAVGSLSSQPLRAERVAGSGSFNFGLNIPSSAATSQEFVLRWRFAPIDGGPWMIVVLRGPNLAVHGSLTLTGSSVIFSSAFGSQNDIVVGSTTMGQDQLFAWTLNRTTGVQSLSIDGVLVVDNLVTGYKSPTVDVTSFAFEGAFQSAMTVAVDDLDVFVGTGAATPTAPSSWGRIKSVYR